MFLLYFVSPTVFQMAPTSKDKLLCDDCGKQFSCRRSLNVHIRTIHQKHFQLKRRLLKCPICDVAIKSREQLYPHLTSRHEIQISFQEKKFPSFDEFQKWKEEIEQNTNTQYVLNRGERRLANGFKKLYYHCSRSGDYLWDKANKTTKLENLDAKKRRIKTQGTKRIGKICPATLEVCYSEKHASAKFWSTHIGHRTDLEHCTLSKTEREVIAGKLAEGMSFEEILNDVRESVTTDTENFTRLHLLTRKDLNNIRKQSFALSHHKHEAIFLVTPSDLSTNEEEKLDDLLEHTETSASSQDATSTVTFQDAIKEKSEQLIGLCESVEIDELTCSTVIEHLNKAIESLQNREKDFSMVKENASEPSNKLVQRFSTFTRSKQTNSDTESETVIVETLEQPNVFYIHALNDHSY